MKIRLTIVGLILLGGLALHAQIVNGGATRTLINETNTFTGDVTFVLTNSLAGAFSVEYSTNLVDWYFLGPATPRYEFTDANAPAVPQRYYRLRWP